MRVLQEPSVPLAAPSAAAAIACWLAARPRTPATRRQLQFAGAAVRCHVLLLLLLVLLVLLPPLRRCLPLPHGRRRPAL